MNRKKLVKLIALLAAGTVLTYPVSAYTGGGVSGALAQDQGAAELSDDDSYDDRLMDFDEEDYSSDEDQDDSYDDSYGDDSYDSSYSDDSDGDDSHDNSYSDDSDGDDSHDNSYSDDSDGDDSHDNSYSDDSDGDDSHDNSYSDDSHDDDSDLDDSDDDDSNDDSSDDSSDRTYLGNFKLTAYCNCAECNGSAGQPTASGRMPSAGRTVAMGGVDFGTRLSINGHIYTVEDTGTPYGHVDIFMESHSEAEDFGVEYADVYLVE